MAAASHGSIKAFWAITAIVATAASATFTVVKERQARAATRTASQARAQLAAGLNRAGAPLLTVLGNVTTAKTPEDMRAAIEVLTARVIDIAHSQCGRSRRPGANLRAVYYSYVDNRLERRDWTGRLTSSPPRSAFTSGANLHDTEVVRFAASDERLLIVDDLYYNAPAHFIDAKGRTYRSFIAVPVRAGETSFGLLTLDSDLGGSLTETDAGHLILLAGVLAAGLAHLASRQTVGMPRGQEC
ncbi:GAF domain-containing protein [Phytohabitans houttuyneae]|uniref:GAF domain-containing protein n=1 Tax=Phytohabitans houttuyneae TaxID=1076126 RepID=A0A6V8K6P8_9ACTN|nr:GAF domain-containing protein [Phytohabitans houttuyneae]GFJ77427.1 hypothetical protein Phou_016070 [Phytohabitans houttuyneae]